MKQTIGLKRNKKFRYKIATWLDPEPNWIYTTAFSSVSLMFRLEQKIETENSEYHPQITIQELN